MTLYFYENSLTKSVIIRKLKSLVTFKKFGNILNLLLGPVFTCSNTNIFHWFGTEYFLFSINMKKFSINLNIFSTNFKFANTIICLKQSPNHLKSMIKFCKSEADKKYQNLHWISFTRWLRFSTYRIINSVKYVMQPTIFL